MRSVVIFYPPTDPALCRKCKCQLPYEDIDIVLDNRPELCGDCQWSQVIENMRNILNNHFPQTESVK